MKLLFFASLVALLSAALGYYDYQTKLPNGQHVPHPCKPNFIWHGVGHLNPMGGGERSQFGKDFASQGHKWTAALCRMDSDGDGLTNGEELGDPGCTWTEGSIAQFTKNVTHPGVCDPWDSAQCRARNTWVTCDVGEFKCDAINNTAGVQTLDLRFPRTHVPTDETTYTCFVFDVPADQPYHLLGFEAIIDNPNVMHHMVAMACDDTAQLTTEPHVCNMGVSGCTETIAIWTLGMTGDCFQKDIGFRFGKGSHRRLAIQHHWTNIKHVENYYDSSGIKMYYTPHLRPYDAAVMSVGQMELDIPPASSSVMVTGSCSPACSRKYMKTPIKIVAALNHMHYLGISGRVEILRQGKSIFNLTNDQPYSYDSPKVNYYDPAIEVLPGDELKMFCEYASMDRVHTTVYGQGSLEEMCFGLLTYYPKESFEGHGSCIQWKEFDMCQFNDEKIMKDYVKIFNESLPETQHNLQTIFDSCNIYGSCRPECAVAIAKLRETNSAMRGSTFEYLKNSFWNNNYTSSIKIYQFMSAIDTCDRQSTTATPTGTTTGSQQGCQMQTGATSGGEGHHMAEGTQPASGTNQAGSFLQQILAKSSGSGPLLQNIIFNLNEK